MPRKTIRDRPHRRSPSLLLSLTAAAAQQERKRPRSRARSSSDILALDGEVFHVQGVDLDSRHIWVTSVDRAGHKGYLHEFDRHSGGLLRRLELTDGPRYHPGGMSLHDGSIWVAVAEMSPNSSATLMEIDTDSFRGPPQDPRRRPSGLRRGRGQHPHRGQLGQPVAAHLRSGQRQAGPGRAQPLRHALSGHQARRRPARRGRPGDAVRRRRSTGSTGPR